MKYFVFIVFLAKACIYDGGDFPKNSDTKITDDIKVNNPCDIDEKIQFLYNEKVKQFVSQFSQENTFLGMKKVKSILLEILKLEKENACLTKSGKLDSIKRDINQKIKSTEVLYDQIKDNDLIERTKYYTELANLLK